MTTQKSGDERQRRNREFSAMDNEKLNQDLDVRTSKLRDRRGSRNRHFDLINDEGWNKEQDMDVLRSTKGKRMEHRALDVSSGVNEGKWNEELDMYTQPTPIPRGYLGFNSDQYMSQTGRKRDSERRAHMEPSSKEGNLWYYDSLPPIGNWRKGWDPKYDRRSKSRNKDNGMYAEDRDVQRDKGRRDVPIKSWNPESSDRHVDSNHFNSNAQVTSWAKSSGSHQQKSHPSHRKQEKEEPSAGINDYLAKLVKKVQETKSELEATQKRLNHTVGRHRVP